jgi:hypothetical protein
VGVLKEIEDAWPYYIPKVTGYHVLKKTTPISDLKLQHHRTGIVDSHNLFTASRVEYEKQGATCVVR